MTKEIPLTKGKVAIVDDSDFEQLSRFNWSAKDAKNNNKFYAHRSVWLGTHQTTILMHVQITGHLMTDHRNGDGLDNRRENLRPCSNAQNQHNRSLNKNSTTGFKGVTFDKESGNFRARINVDGKRKNLGRFRAAIDAAHTYDKAAKLLYGEFARLNFPESES